MGGGRKYYATHHLAISKRIIYKILYFSCPITYELKVSVEQGLFKVDEGNWLVTCKKLKGYLHYKTIFCHKVALDVQLMNFFIWSKNNVCSRYI